MPSYPSSLALTNIADGASIIASDHRNNYAAVQTGFNGLLTALAVTAKGDLLVATASGAIVNVAIGANNTVLTADSTQTSGVKWASGATVTTSLYSGGPPGSPSAGDVWHATAVDTGNLATTNGTVWTFKYNASSGSASKWEFIGGTPLIATITTAQGANLGGWGDLGTVGPTMTLARAGDYWVTGSAQTLSGASADSLSMGIANGAGTPTDPLVSIITPTVGNAKHQHYVQGPMLGLAASATPRMRYSGGAQVDTWNNRVLTVTPIRIT